MASTAYTAEQREAADHARRETVEQLHQQLAENISNLDNLEAWQQWLTLASSLHRYSFNNTLLILIQKPEATAVAGYRAWQAQGHQVRRGEKAIKVLGPVTAKAQLTDPSTGVALCDANGQPCYERRMVGVKPVSVFDASQVEPAPPTPPMPALLVGEAPPGLWDALAELVDMEGYQLSRGDCGGPTGSPTMVLGTCGSAPMSTTLKRSRPSPTNSATCSCRPKPLECSAQGLAVGSVKWKPNRSRTWSPRLTGSTPRNTPSTTLPAGPRKSRPQGGA